MGPGVAAKVENWAPGRSPARDEEGVWSALRWAWPARHAPSRGRGLRHIKEEKAESQAPLPFPLGSVETSNRERSLSWTFCLESKAPA